MSILSVGKDYSGATKHYCLENWTMNRCRKSSQRAIQHANIRSSTLVTEPHTQGSRYWDNWRGADANEKWARDLAIVKAKPLHKMKHVNIERLLHEWELSSRMSSKFCIVVGCEVVSWAASYQNKNELKERATSLCNSNLGGGVVFSSISEGLRRINREGRVRKPRPAALSSIQQENAWGLFKPWHMA